MNIRDIILWRDLKVTAIVFTSVFLLLVSFTQYPVVSVLTNVTMLLMLPMLVIEMLMSAKSACLNAEFELPFKTVLPKGIDVSKDKVLSPCMADQYGVMAAEWIQNFVAIVSRLILVEDLAYSLKVFVALYMTSYLSQWLSGITLIFVGFICLFTIPKIHDMYKDEIQKCVSKIQGAVNDVTSTITAKFPAGKPKGDEANGNNDNKKKS